MEVTIETVSHIVPSFIIIAQECTDYNYTLLRKITHTHTHKITEIKRALQIIQFTLLILQMKKLRSRDIFMSS